MKLALAVVALIVLGGVVYALVPGNKFWNRQPVTTSKGPQANYGTSIGMGTPPPPPPADAGAYIKGQVVSIDPAGKKLSYRQYTFTTLGTTIETVTFPDAIPVYKATSDSQLAEGTTTTLQDIKPGQTVFIQIDRKAPPPDPNGKSIPGISVFTPLSFTVLEK